MKRTYKLIYPAKANDSGLAVGELPETFGELMTLREAQEACELFALSGESVTLFNTEAV